ncbi:glycerol-3-phosphate acyltransferase [Chloroflexota bacterium]
MTYQLDSIPTAHIVTRLTTDANIPRLGVGNARVQNIFQELGQAAVTAIVIFDTGRGVTAITVTP